MVEPRALTGDLVADIARDPLSLRGASEAALAALDAEGVYSAQFVARSHQVIAHFVAFAEGAHLVTDAVAATPAVAEAFVRSRTRDGLAPAANTMHLRRSALRLLFRALRQLDVVDGDPTLDIALPPRSARELRALTEDEIALCRSFAVPSLGATRPAAAWALAEATATTAELARVRPVDLDVDNRRVWLDGGTKTRARWGQISDWGTAALERHRRHRPLRRDASSALIYEAAGSAQSRHSSGSQAITMTLVRAGLGGEPDVRPASVTAWAGQRILVETGHIEEVARRLGLASLDRAARLIGWDWAEGEEL